MLTSGLHMKAYMDACVHTHKQNRYTPMSKAQAAKQRGRKGRTRRSLSPAFFPPAGSSAGRPLPSASVFCSSTDSSGTQAD